MTIERPIRMAGCSGCATDRRDVMSLLASAHPTDPVDVITGDWLSEANMTSRGVSKIEFPDEPAYEPTFLESLKPALQDISRYSIKVVCNAGASDTERLWREVEKMVEEAAVGLRVAWVEGDEVMDEVRRALEGNESELENVYTGEKLNDWRFEPVCAQAYLGGMGIAAALEAGADIVICGRVSDASPVIGAAAWWHKWDRSKLDELANSLIAGHLIECSSYVTGGNFTGFKRLQSSGWQNIGYPIAEISSSGQVILTKNRGSGGEVSTHTCTSQLLYEIQGPWYFNSDVTAVLTNIAFEQLETDRVALKGVQGDLPPTTTKVGITAKGGFQAEMHWFMTGLDIKEKAAMMEVHVRHLLRPHSARFSVLEFTINGSVPENPKDQNAATVDFRILAQAPVADDLAPHRFARPCLDSIMATYPGATPHLDLRTAMPRPIYEYYVTLMPQTSIKQVVHTPWIAAASYAGPEDSSASISVAPPQQTRAYPKGQPLATSSGSNARSAPKTTGGAADAAGGWAELPAQMGRNVLREVFGPWGRTVRGPLGWIAHGRSGDKGSDCNVGLWVRRKGEYDWLRSVLTVERIKHLLGPEYKEGKPIERCEFEGLRAAHFLLKEHLDRGVGATRSYDALGKNVAEFLRARYVDLPVKFIERGKI